MKLDLNGKWQFKSSRDASFFDAVVPGTNFLDLIRLDRMKNPLVDVSPENTRDNEWFFRAGTDDWIYRKTFNVKRSPYRLYHRPEITKSALFFYFLFGHLSIIVQTYLHTIPKTRSFLSAAT